MSVFFRSFSRGLHTVSAMLPASRTAFINTQKDLTPAMVQVNQFLMAKCYVTLELSPHQIYLAQKTENYWLLELRNMWAVDSRPIGIFQINKPSNGGWDLKNWIAPRLYSVVVNHLFAEKKDDIHILRTYGTKLDLHLLSLEDKRKITQEMDLLFINITSTKIVRAAKTGELIYFFDEEDADPTATTLVAAVDTKKRNEDGTLSLEFVSVGAKEREKFRELLITINSKEKEERKKLSLQILSKKV